MSPRALPFLLAGLLASGSVLAGQADHVKATDGWIRVMPGGLPAGGYVTLRNEGDEAAVLRAASSPAYAGVMLHESMMASGSSRMKALDHLDVPAHRQVALAPGGYHFMMMKPAHKLEPNARVPVTLEFADGSRLTVDFLARPPYAMGPGK